MGLRICFMFPALYMACGKLTAPVHLPRNQDRGGLDTPPYDFEHGTGVSAIMRSGGGTRAKPSARCGPYLVLILHWVRSLMPHNVRPHAA